MYPYKSYFDNEMNDKSSFFRKGHSVQHLFDIINKRYREQGFDINWLFLSKEDDIKLPDMRSVPNYVDIREEDKILVAGVTAETLKKDDYPNGLYILNQLPPHIKLYVGGFHSNDCVYRLSKVSHNLGVYTFIDDDTTNLFFSTHSRKPIPLIRTDWSLRTRYGDDIQIDV